MLSLLYAFSYVIFCQQFNFFEYFEFNCLWNSYEQLHRKFRTYFFDRSASILTDHRSGSVSNLTVDVRNGQDRSGSISIDQDRSGSIRINQERSGSVRISQDWSGPRKLAFSRSLITNKVLKVWFELWLSSYLLYFSKIFK